MKKRIISILLTLCMLLSAVPMMAFTASAEATYGSDITFDKVLTSTGGTLLSGNYRLTQNVTLTSDIAIQTNATVNINLNGYVLCGTGSNSVITIANNAVLNVYDYSTSPTPNTHCFIVPSGTTGLWQWNESSGTQTVQGGCITGGNAKTNGGAVYCLGTFNLYGGTICGNKAIDVSLGNGYARGGGVYIYGNKSFTMYGGAICGNKAKNSGGIGLDTYSTAVLKEGTTISYNEAEICGGCSAAGSVSLTATGVEFSYNKSTSPSAGAIQVASNKVVLNECTIKENISAYSTLPNDTGAIVVSALAGKLVINGGNVINNKAVGIYAGSGVTIEISGKLIVSNNLWNGTDRMNLFLASGAFITVGSNGLKYNSSIGVVPASRNPLFFLKGGTLDKTTLERYAYYFSYDQGQNYGAQYVSNSTQYGLLFAYGVVPTDPGPGPEDKTEEGGLLTFTANKATGIYLAKYGSPDAINISYSTDGGSTWNTYAINNTINLNAGASVSFKGTNSTFSKNTSS